MEHIRIMKLVNVSIVVHIAKLVQLIVVQFVMMDMNYKMVSVYQVVIRTAVLNSTI